MNLPYIQTEIFHELVGMETLLKPECEMKIIKHQDGNMSFEVYKKKFPFLRHAAFIEISLIKTGDDITKTINKIWDDIPAEYKRTDILK